ncbi:MAG: L-rhamnose mutarotase [Victivallales bacterium]|nr:L-rhamnose mutarotase [Victivallales bacterium]
MIRKTFLMKVKPGMIDEYEKVHNPIWPELQKVIKAHGVHNFSIYFHEKTNQLFGYVEIEDEKKFKEREQTEICQRWFREMKKYLVPDPDGANSQKDELREIFHID